MLNLLELALEATRNNVVKSSKKESINDSLVRILFDDKKKLTRVELVAQISLDRLESEHSREVLEDIVKKDKEKFLSMFEKVNKTVKNGLDTSISSSQNNSSFSYNEKYNHLKLNYEGGKYTITEKLVKTETKK